MSDADQSARAALRARQGGGARYDAATAPHDDLLLARRGTAYFARRLNALRDEELSAPSQRQGWSRRHLIAHVSLEARALALALKQLRAPLIAEEAAWQADLELAATLPARALRHLFEHSAKHLDVEWRDLPAALWPDARFVIVAEPVAVYLTPRLRAAAIWHAAVDLGNGGRLSDFPADLRD